MISDLIYDIGLHRGEDTEFYLKKGYRVVAFEANPSLVQECKSKFASELETGKLRIVEGAITPNFSSEKVTFYINSRASIWGTVEPDWAERNAEKGFSSEAIKLDAVDIAAVMTEFGVPYYMKIDVEGVDLFVLESLHQFPDRPKYVSIESEKVEFQDLIREFDILESLGYKKFKVVQQRNIPGMNIESSHLSGSNFLHTFKDFSSGPFGEEINEPWLGRGAALKKYETIFKHYKLFGDKSKYINLPRLAKGVISTLYKGATGHRGPLPGWFDTHASQ